MVLYPVHGQFVCKLRPGGSECGPVSLTGGQEVTLGRRASRSAASRVFRITFTHFSQSATKGCFGSARNRTTDPSGHGLMLDERLIRRPLVSSAANRKSKSSHRFHQWRVTWTGFYVSRVALISGAFCFLLTRLTDVSHEELLAVSREVEKCSRGAGSEDK